MFSPKCVRKVPLSFIRSTIRFARDDPFISFDSSLTLSRQIFFFLYIDPFVKLLVVHARSHGE